MDHILKDHGVRMNLFAAVVMPDHAHLLFGARISPSGQLFSLAEIMNGIRGPSAHRINRVLQRKGSVWDEEFFDHVPRFGEFEQEVEYICDNPVRAGLVWSSEDYQWLWVDPML
jgi:REP element-mobilizing transposase RayT